MNYFEIKLIFNKADPWKEIFTSLLAEAGCESFMDGEDENVLLAYIPEHLYNYETIRDIIENQQYDVKIKFIISSIETQNWNALWESNYSPVLIGDRCHIHAPFHEKRKDIEYNIVIEPKMSFGTAHHETTSMMIEFMLSEDLKNKSFLDMGAGTGILAILAYKMGANPILAVDIDEWAYHNNLENNSRNNADLIDVQLGDISVIQGRSFDIIFANINRNILFNDIPVYSQCLKNDSLLFLSGFYHDNDLDMLKERCKEFHLKYLGSKEKNRWAAAKFRKEE